MVRPDTKDRMRFIQGDSYTNRSNRQTPKRTQRDLSLPQGEVFSQPDINKASDFQTNTEKWVFNGEAQHRVLSEQDIANLTQSAQTHRQKSVGQNLIYNPGLTNQQFQNQGKRSFLLKRRTNQEPVEDQGSSIFRSFHQKNLLLENHKANLNNSIKKMELITQEAKKIKISKKVIQSLSKNKMKKHEKSPMPIPDLAKRQFA